MWRPVAFTPDGKRLVTWWDGSQPRRGLGDPRPGDGEVLGYGDRTATSLPPQRPRRQGAGSGPSPDGTHLATTRGSGNPTVLVCDLATGELVTLEGPAKQTAHGVTFSPDGKRLACGVQSGCRRSNEGLTALDPDLGPGHAQAVVTIDRLPFLHLYRMCFSPDGKLLAGSAASLGLVKVWDAATGREAFYCKFTDGGLLWDVAFSPDGKRLAAFANKGIRIWDVASRETQVTWPSDSKGSPDLAFSPDGNRLATGGVEGLLELWDTATGQKVQTFKGHFGPVHAIAFSPDGTRLATGCVDGTVRLWDATARRDAISIPQDGLPLTETPELSPDGQTLLTGFEWPTRRPLRFWDTATGEPALRPDRASPCRGRTGLDRRRQTPLLHRRQDRERRGRRVRQGGPHVPDRCRRPIATASPSVPTRNGSPTLVAVARSRCGMPRPAPYFARSGDSTACTGALVFSPDGSRLLGADEYGTLKIWDFATGREIAATKLTGVLIVCARFSADGKRFAVAGAHGQLLTGEVRILDAETAREVWSLKGHTLMVRDVVFSPDGLRLATASGNDGTVRLWDLTAGQEILKLVDSVGVGSVRFVSDGRRLIGATRDRRIRVWDATPLPE